MNIFKVFNSLSHHRNAKIKLLWKFKKKSQKTMLVQNCFIWLTGYSPYLGSQGTYLGRRKGRYHEKNSVHWHDFSGLFNQLFGTVNCLGMYRLQWFGPSYINRNQENIPQVCPENNLMEAITEFRFPRPRCVTLTTEANHDSLLVF